MNDIGGLNSITHEFLDGFRGASHYFIGTGLDLAYLLATIALAVQFTFMLVQGKEPWELMSKLVQQIFLFGFCFGLIHLCYVWVPQIINTFMFVGGKASGLGGLSPDSVFLTGVNITMALAGSITKMGLLHFASALLAVFAALMIFIVYMFICAELIVVMVKSYALIAVGPIVFALGVIDITKSSMINYLRKVLGLGFQLMMLYILIGIGVKLGHHWVEIGDQVAQGKIWAFKTVLPILGGLVVLYIVIKNVPAFIAQIPGAGGFRNYGDAAIASAMTGAALGAKTMVKGGGLGYAMADSGISKGIAGAMGGWQGGQGVAQMGHGFGANSGVAHQMNMDNQISGKDIIKSAIASKAGVAGAYASKAAPVAAAVGGAVTGVIAGAMASGATPAMNWVAKHGNVGKLGK